MLKKMKKLKYIYLLPLLLAFTACDDLLDVEPEQSLSTDAAFADESTAFASLMGVYSGAQDFDVFGSVTAVISEYMADNVDFAGSFPTLQEINNYNTIAGNGSIRSIWRDHYSAILAANAVIANVPNVDDGGFTADERAQFIAEAKYMRGLIYFNLVNLFAQPYNVQNGGTPGVPLVLTPTILEGEAIMPARNTVAEVYDQIEQDMTEALPDLPESYSSAVQTRGRATKGAANALLSRLYLYKGEWANAVSSADAVLANKDLYDMAPDYTFFDANTPETVLDIQMTTTDNSRTGAGGWSGYYLPASRGGRGDAPMAADLLAAYDQTNDRRFTELTFTGTDAQSRSAVFTNKFPDGVTSADNAPIFRVTEVMLNKAEAMVKNSNAVEDEAIMILNQLLARAGLPAVSAGDFADAQALIDRILVERRKELAFEGHRRMDLLRNGLPLRTAAGDPGLGISSPGDPKVVLPIPQNEIDLGAALPQNPGY